MYVHVSRHLLLKIACTFSDHTDLAVWLIGQGADVNKSEINGRTNPFEEAVIRDQVQVSYIPDLNGKYSLFFYLVMSIHILKVMKYSLIKVLHNRLNDFFCFLCYQPAKRSGIENDIPHTIYFFIREGLCRVLYIS